MAKNHSKQITHHCAVILSGIGVLTLALSGLSCWAQLPATVPSPTPEPSAATSGEVEGSGEVKDPSELRTIPKAMPTSRRLAAQERQLLAKVDSPATPVWINVQGRQVLGFWRANASATPLGAVLMVHDRGHSPLWPNTLRDLHRILPRFGWATLSIEMPDLAQSAVPERTRMEPPLARLPKKTQTDTEQPPETTPQADEAKTAAETEVDETQVVYQDKKETATQNTDQNEPTKMEADTKMTAASPTIPLPTAEEVEQAAMATMQAGLDFLQQQNQFNIVLLGEGYGAVRALRFITQAEVGSPPEQNRSRVKKRGVVDRPIRALILLDAHLPDTGTTDQENGGLTELIQYPEVPTLDLITSVDLEVREQAAQRKRKSRMMHYQTYSSRRLMPQPGVPSNDKESDITKSIRGFLKQHAPGVEL